MTEAVPRSAAAAFAATRSGSEYFAAYDAVLAQWPVAVESTDVPSAYGTTRVQVCGPETGPPLVLLHGGGATSTAWFATVGRLARAHRVYAPDQIGDAGRSVHDGRPITTPGDLMDWLDCLLDSLGVERVVLCGHSYGGWLALSYALHAPRRVSRLALLDPSECFTGMRLGYRLHALPLFVRPSAQRMRAFLRWETGGQPLDPAWARLAALGAEFPSTKVVMPRRPPPERLREATTPTLVVTAQCSRQHAPAKLAAAAQRLMPGVALTELPHASHHTVPTEHADPLAAQLLEFLT